MAQRARLVACASRQWWSRHKATLDRKRAAEL